MTLSLFDLTDCMSRGKAQLTPFGLDRWLGLSFGDVAEWLKAPDCKSARRLAPSVGSNPTISGNQSPDGSANFHRGELSTQPKATRLSRRIVRLFCVGFNKEFTWFATTARSKQSKLEKTAKAINDSAVTNASGDSKKNKKDC